MRASGTAPEPLKSTRTARRPTKTEDVRTGRNSDQKYLRFSERGFLRLLGHFLEAAKDLRLACKIDFDEQADEWLKEVTPNVRIDLDYHTTNSQKFYFLGQEVGGAPEKTATKTRREGAAGKEGKNSKGQRGQGKGR